MGDIGEAILRSIEQLGARLDASIAQINARIDAVGARIDALSSGVDERLSTLDRRLLTIEIHMTTIDKRLTTLENVVSSLDAEVRTWPDMHYLAGAARTQIVNARTIKTDMVDLKSRMDEIYQSMEIGNLRDEVARFRDRSIDFDVRIGTAESRLGIASNTTL